MRKVYLLGLAVAALVVVGCSSAPNKADDYKDANPVISAAGVSPTVSVTPNPGTRPSLSIVILSAGSWTVGKKDDVAAHTITSGTWTISSPDDGVGCYWERVKDFSGSFDDIIANGNIDPGSIVYVTIKSSDKGLQLNNDCIGVKKRK